MLGAEGVLMLVLSSSLSLPVTASFLRNDPVAVQGPAPGEVLFRLAIGPAVAVFLLLAMADHLLVASPGLHRWYESALERRANYLFAANTAMILFGLLMERHVTVTPDRLVACFGPWTCHTTASNVRAVHITGPYRAYRAIAPRLSLADHGLTFGTTTRHGACLLFREPVPGLDPFGAIRHPGLTLTVADPQRFAASVRDYAGLPTTGAGEIARL